MKRAESPEDQKAGLSRDTNAGAPPKKRAKLLDNDVTTKKPAPKTLDQEESAHGDTKLAASDGASTDMDVASVRPSPSPAPSDAMAQQTFPQRLMEMLDKQVVPDAMWWAEEGKAFAMDLSKFGDVLHHHFQATKYASFTRKLNKWGFRKLNNIDPEAPDSVVLYRHDLFQKDQPGLLKSMSTKRKKKEKKGGKTKKGEGEQDDSERVRDTSISASEEIDDIMGDQAEGEVDVEREVDIQEEKGYESSPQRAPQHLRFQEGEGREEGTSNYARQQLQQQLSFASSLAAHRITHQQGDTPGGPSSSGLSRSAAGLSAAGLQGGQSAVLRDAENRQLLQSLISQESEQQQQHQRRMELALLRQQRENLANEMLAQRRLAASAGTPGRLSLGSPSLALEGNLPALQDPTLGLHQLTSRAVTRTAPAPSRSHSLNDLPSALPLQGNLSDLASRLRMQQSQNQALDMAASLNLQSQNLSELRAALEARSQTDIASALQLMTNQPQGSQLGASDALSALQLLQSRSNQSALPSALHHSRSFPDIPLLQMQAQQEQERQLAATASVAAASSAATRTATSAASNATSTEQQLLEVLLERQRLQAQLLEEQQRRQRR